MYYQNRVETTNTCVMENMLGDQGSVCQGKGPYKMVPINFNQSLHVDFDVHTVKICIHHLGYKIKLEI